MNDRISQTLGIVDASEVAEQLNRDLATMLDYTVKRFWTTEEFKSEIAKRLTEIKELEETLKSML